MSEPIAPDQRIYDHARSIADLYRLAAAAYGDRPAMAKRGAGGDYQVRTYGELYEDGCALAEAFIALGVKAREHIALLSDNRPEWLICDCATLLCGAADVPRAADITEQEITYIVAHSDAVLVVAENLRVLKRVLAAREWLPSVRDIVLIEGEPPEGSGVLRLEDLLSRGRRLREDGSRDAEKRLEAIEGKDIFTIIYTSGTTGTPKGVTLTHDNMLSQVRYLPFDLYPTDRVLSILPVWHSYERVFEMVALSRGVCTYYTTLRTIGDDLRKVRPTFMASAPRLWEALYTRILQSVRSASAPRRLLFRAAYRCSLEFQRARFFLRGQLLDTHGRTWGESLSLAARSLATMAIYAIPYAILDALVLRKLRGIVGGSFRGTVSGGGALPPHVDEFFNYIGIPVLEGYGMTETSPVLAVRTFPRRVIGTVGPIWPHTEIRIVELGTGRVIYPNWLARGGGRGIKGEIHARGPQVMAGYYKDAEATDRVIKDGWMNTGDLGMVTFNNCLKILGRSKETIVLLNGENVEPQPIENQLLESPLIEQCMVVGQDEKFLGALIIPSLSGLKDQGLEFSSIAEAEADERTARMLDAEIKRLVGKETGFKPFEFIQAWEFVAKPFEVGDELTPTFKPKRHIIAEKYANLVNKMFRGTRSSAGV